MTDQKHDATADVQAAQLAMLGRMSQATFASGDGTQSFSSAQ